MKKLFVFVLGASFLMGLPAFAHEPSLSKELLKSLFPEADNFVNRKKTLTAAQITQVEKASGDKTQQADRNLNVFVAVARDPATQRMKSIGAVLMVDAEGEKGLIDLVLACNPDGSIRKVLIVKNSDDKALESATFLGQLEGKAASDPWNVEKDFTLVGNSESAKAVIRAVRRGMHLFLAFIG